MSKERRPLNNTAPVPSPESTSLKLRSDSEKEATCAGDRLLSEFLSRHEEEISRLVKDAMTSSDGNESFKNILGDEFKVTPENIDCLLNYAKKHLAENGKIDMYSLIAARISLEVSDDAQKYVLADIPDCQELKDKILNYTEAFLDYGKRLDDRQKAIDNLSHSIDLIADPAVKEAVSQQYENLLDIHEEITCHRYAMEELRLKVEKEKWKHTQTTLGEPDDPVLTEINDNMSSIRQSAVSQEEKLKQLQELSKENIIRQEEIKGDLPEGGIRHLKSLLEETPSHLARIYADRFSKITSILTPKQWQVYNLHRDGISNAKIASELDYSHPHIGKMLKEIDQVFRENDLPSEIQFYIRPERVPFFMVDKEQKEKWDKDDK